MHTVADCERVVNRIGGKSVVNLDLGPESKGRFWGSLSSELRAGRRKDGVIERGGYCGMRSKVRLQIRLI